MSAAPDLPQPVLENPDLLEETIAEHLGLLRLIEGWINYQPHSYCEADQTEAADITMLLSNARRRLRQAHHLESGVEAFAEL